MDVINSFIRAQGSKFWGKWGSGIKITARKRDQWVPDIPCYDPGINTAVNILISSFSTKTLNFTI